MSWAEDPPFEGLAVLPCLYSNGVALDVEEVEVTYQDRKGSRCTIPSSSVDDKP